MTHKSRYSPKSGKTRKRVARPRFGLTEKLANLNVLLRAPSIRRWPLEVKFFAEDVFKAWQRADAKTTLKVRPGIRIALDESVKDIRTGIRDGILVELPDTQHTTGVYALDVTYQPAKLGLEKSRKLLAQNCLSCSVCEGAFDSSAAMTLVCPEDACRSVAHMACLSNSFLAEEGRSDVIVPTQGSCPACKETLSWPDLVRDLSLRVRGEKEVAALFKPPRGRKKKPGEETDNMPVAEDASDAESNNIDVASDDDMDGGIIVPPQGLAVDEISVANEAVPDNDLDWHCVDDDVDEIMLSKAAHPGDKALKTSGNKSEIIIEDSDWEEAEVLD